MKRCQKAKISYVEMEKVINQYWISRSDITTLLPQLTYSAAGKEFNKILKEMKENNEFFFNTRPCLIPVRKVIDKFNIDVNLIRRESSKMKKYMEGNSK